MSRRFQIKSHVVEGSKIVRVQPLVMAGKMLSPEAGLTLVLDDDTQHNWLSEKDAPVPSVGDLLVRDHALNATYVLAAATFGAMIARAPKSRG